MNYPLPRDENNYIQYIQLKCNVACACEQLEGSMQVPSECFARALCVIRKLTKYHLQANYV